MAEDCSALETAGFVGCAAHCLSCCTGPRQRHSSTSHHPPRSTGGYDEPLIARHERQLEAEGTSAGLDGVAPGTASMDRTSGGGSEIVPVADEQVTYNYSQVGAAAGSKGYVLAWPCLPQLLVDRSIACCHVSRTACRSCPRDSTPHLPVPLKPLTPLSLLNQSLPFYLVFALASMYIAMLMTGWGSQAGEAKVGPGGRQPAGASAGAGAGLLHWLGQRVRCLAVAPLLSNIPHPCVSFPASLPPAVPHQRGLDQRVGQDRLAVGHW